MAAAIAAPAVWGFLTIPLKQLHGYQAQDILYYRVFISLILVWAINLCFRYKTVAADFRLLGSLRGAERNKTLLLILGTGIFITGNWFGYIYVVSNLNIQVAAFAYLICPLLTACGGFLILKEPLTPLKMAAVGLAVLSIVVLSAASLVQACWAFGVAVMYAAYIVIQRVLTRFDKLTMLGIQLIIAALLLLPFFIHHNQPAPQQAVFWVNVVLIAAVFTILPLALSMYALMGLPSSTLGIALYINPILAFTVAFVYFKEPFDFSRLAGYALLLIAVIVFNADLFKAVAFKKRIFKTAV